MKDLFNILVPTDYSEESMPALEYALSISEKFSATIYILHSYQLPVYPQEMPSEPSGIELQGVEDEAEAKMNDLIKGLQAKHEKATIISLVNYGEVETMIDELVEEKNIDLLILSSKGGNAAKALLFGSICADSIGKVKCPIIIVPKGFKVSDTKNIAYAANWVEEDDIKGIKNLLPWAKAFDAKITVVHIYTSNESYSKRDRHEYEAKLHESVDGAALEVACLKAQTLATLWRNL